MSKVVWQGGCELRDAEGARIGNLYVTTEDIFFIEAGRGGVVQYRQALVLLALAGAILVVPLSSEIYAWTYRSGLRSMSVAVTEVVCAVLAVGFLGMAAHVAWSLKKAYEDGLRKLGEDDGSSPEPAMLEAAADAVSGSLRLPVADAERLVRNKRRLSLETRLGETWDLLILPSPDSFVAAVKPI